MDRRNPGFFFEYLAQFRPVRPRPRPFSLRDGGRRAVPGTRPESIMFFSNGLELMRGNGSHVNSNDSDVEKEGSVESRVIGTTRLNAAKLYA